MTLTNFESEIQVLGDRVMLKAIPKPSAIVQLDEKKMPGDIVIVAVGNGPNMATRYAALKVGAKVAVTDIGFKEILDPVEKRVYRLYTADDILCLMPD